MRLKIGLLVACIALCGCGISRRQTLRDMDALIQKSKSVDCQTIRGYLHLLQNKIREELK